MPARDSIRAVMLAGVLVLGGLGNSALAGGGIPTEPASSDAEAGKAIIAQSQAYLKDKQARHYDRAYAMIAGSMQSYLTPALFRDGVDRFLSEAGAPGELRFTRLSWYRDPPDAPESGLYAAVDFTADYANIELMCGYLMWHRLADGRFKLVREEQNFIDRRAAQQMVPEQRRNLPRLFGCVSP